MNSLGARCTFIVATASLFSLVPDSMLRAVNIETVLVFNSGNAADVTGVGAVSYEYRIGKYEVTNSQYSEFLNAVDPNGTNVLALYDSQMTSSVWGGIEYS